MSLVLLFRRLLQELSWYTFESIIWGIHWQSVALIFSSFSFPLLTLNRAQLLSHIVAKVKKRRKSSTKKSTESKSSYRRRSAWEFFVSGVNLIKIHTWITRKVSSLMKDIETNWQLVVKTNNNYSIRTEFFSLCVEDTGFWTLLHRARLIAWVL